MGKVIAWFTVIWAALWWAGIVVVMMSLTGCVKTIQWGEHKRIDFITGLGVEASANGSDTLDNNRAIRPAGNGYVSKAKD